MSIWEFLGWYYGTLCEIWSNMKMFERTDFLEICACTMVFFTFTFIVANGYSLVRLQLFNRFISNGRHFEFFQISKFWWKVAPKKIRKIQNCRNSFTVTNRKRQIFIFILLRDCKFPEFSLTLMCFCEIPWLLSQK